MGADSDWWRRYGANLDGFAGERWSPSTVRGVRKMKPLIFQNSGAGAIELAAQAGAQRILLLGFDCQHTGGRAHWHADHPCGMGNAGSVPQWPALFRRVAAALADIQIINCSRHTALTCWPAGRLEQELACSSGA